MDKKRHFMDVLEISKREKSIQLNIANETREDVTVTVRWALRSPDGLKLRNVYDIR